MLSNIVTFFFFEKGYGDESQSFHLATPMKFDSYHPLPFVFIPLSMSNVTGVKSQHVEHCVTFHALHQILRKLPDFHLF